MRLTAILLILACGLAAFIFWERAPVIRYRLTVTAEVDGDIVKGSGVRQIKFERTYALNPDVPGIRARVSGEAFALDLGARGIVFFLLSHGRDFRSAAGEIVFKVFDFSRGQLADAKIPLAERLQMLQGVRNLPIGSLPKAITFADISDWRSAKIVDPENLAATFGPGVKIIGATIEITNDAVTRGVLNWLPWIVRDGYLKSRVSPVIDDPTAIIDFDEFERLRGRR